MPLLRSCAYLKGTPYEVFSPTCQFGRSRVHKQVGEEHSLVCFAIAKLGASTVVGAGKGCDPGVRLQWMVQAPPSLMCVCGGGGKVWNKKNGNGVWDKQDGRGEG